MCFETGSVSEKRSPVKREGPRSHDPASSPLTSKASSKSVGGTVFLRMSENEQKSFIFTENCKEKGIFEGLDFREYTYFRTGVWEGEEFGQDGEVQW